MRSKKINEHIMPTVGLLGCPNITLPRNSFYPVSPFPSVSVNPPVPLVIPRRAPVPRAPLKASLTPRTLLLINESRRTNVSTRFRTPAASPSPQNWYPYVDTDIIRASLDTRLIITTYEAQRVAESSRYGAKNGLFIKRDPPHAEIYFDRNV